MLAGETVAISLAETFCWFVLQTRSRWECLPLFCEVEIFNAVRSLGVADERGGDIIRLAEMPVDLDWSPEL